MDTGQLQLSYSLVNQIIGAVLVILLWKLLPSCFNLLMKARQKLKTIGFTNPIPEELAPKYINDELMKEDNTKASSLDLVKHEYEVFLSFRGDDTRKNFLSHLYKALKTKGIHTFIDDRELERGKTISPSLLEAIKMSKIAIVVLSPNYASSSWCLDELIEIIECMKIKQQIILPIFYNVDPSDVEHQMGVLIKAFEKHQEKFSNDKIKKWKNALSIIATISGWVSQECAREATLIECVARDVSDRLICKGSSCETHLVGIEYHVKNVDAKLGFKSNDVRMVGIWGIGGVGKTTIADFVYCRDSSKYEACCRLKNIKDKYKNGGAIALQKELVSQILSEKKLDIWDEYGGCDILRRRLQSKKVLILLDDIDELEQLKVLANDLTWFGQGSRIIITTRDKRLLVEHNVEYIYEVFSLEEDKALQCFSLHAFKNNQPPNKFLDLSKKFVSYTQGLPLALKILGISLYKRDIDFWQCELEKLKRIPNVKIYRIMKISYDGLEDIVQSVFLDIAFSFIGESKITVENTLNHALRAFTILEERALLTISYNRFEMHELVKMMAYEIVREEAKDPRKRSRLCHPEDIYRVLMNCEEETSIESISLNMSELHQSLYLEANTFKKMDHLKIIKFFRSYEDKRVTQKIHFLKSGGSLPNGLRYFSWDFFPLKSLPFTSFGENLVELLLRESNMENLWEGEMEFKNLKKIDVSESTSLKALPDLSRAPNIEEIYLLSCESFHEFSSGLQELHKLKILNFSFCVKLDKLPMLPLSLVELHLDYSGVTELPPGFQFLAKLKILNLSKSGELKARLTRFDAITEFPQSSCELKSLKKLYLSYLPIVELPQSIAHLHELKLLHLRQCEKLLRLPSGMHKLVSLEEINLECCTSLVSLPKLPPSLKILAADYCESLETLERNDWNHFRQLVQLRFGKCHKLDDRSRNEIMECARLMFHSPKRYYCKSTKVGWAEDTVIVPGRKIPEWFDYKSSESSITITLPPSPHQIRGFALYVADADLHLATFTVRSDLIHFKRKVYSLLTRPDGRHVMIWYIHFNDLEKEALTTYHGREIQFNISGCDLRAPPRNLKVKEWGIHMILDEEGY